MLATRIALVLALSALTACPAAPVAEPGTTPAKPSRGISPSACGKLDTSDVGRKIHAFLVSSAELDQSSFELEQTVHRACVRMAGELQIPAEGDTRTLCDRVSKELQDSMQVSVSQEQRLVTRTKPAVCTTEVDFAAQVAAECEAKARADISIRCDGHCEGSCSGRCDGTCSATAADGSCAGTCDGTCRGSCSGGCRGGANVEASAECRAAAEVRADIRTTCTEPEVVVVTENVTVVDATRLDRAVRAIQVGLPVLLRAGAKAKIVAKAAVYWAKTAANLAGAGGKVFAELGKRGACVAVQLAAAVAASAQISARIDVSVEVSASMSASAGVQ